MAQDTSMNVTESFQRLQNYIEYQGFKGWDPYDGLNSKLFQATPLKHWDLARLAWIQGFKRSPINLRKPLLVPKEYNAKGIGLLLSGYCNLYHLATKGNEQLGTCDELLSKIVFLADLLLELQNKNYSGACWGYNFDWQARRLFLFPKNTPTVVATTFCVSALFAAYEITKDNRYKEVALSAANFVLNDLNRTPQGDGYILSYSPLKGNDTVFNASLLGAKLLSLCYAHGGNEAYKREAELIVKTVCQAQATDGSWVYGLLPTQAWIDSFHTGYNLESIQSYQDLTGDKQFEPYLAKGFDFYIQHFFGNDGTPKYYHNKMYPIDIHCPGQLFVTLHRMNNYTVHKDLTEKVISWTLKHMQAKKGYFYYQLKKGVSSKISYMRWSNAFMFHAMSCFLLHSTTD